MNKKTKKVELGCTEFVANPEQWEEGVEQKVKGTPETSLWRIHKGKKC